MTWRATVLTLFPEMFPGRWAPAWRARRWRRASGRWKRAISGIRPPTATAASTTLRPVAAPAWCCAPMCWRPRSMPRMPRTQNLPRLLMSPRGRPLTQSRVKELAAGPGPLIVCGRFEGIDQRVIEARGLRGGFDRRLRAFGRRNRRHGPDRRLCPAAAGRDGKLAVPEPRKAFPTDYWNTRNTPARRHSRAGRSRKS